MIIKKKWSKEKATYLKAFCHIFGVFFHIYLERSIFTASYKHPLINPPSPPIGQVNIILVQASIWQTTLLFYTD